MSQKHRSHRSRGNKYSKKHRRQRSQGKKYSKKYRSQNDSNQIKKYRSRSKKYRKTISYKNNINLVRSKTMRGGNDSMKDKFTNIYKKNIWGSSGSGSNFSINNKWFLNELRNIIDKYKIKSIADLGCGDWEIMSHFQFNKDEVYTGIDCVDFLIKKHNKKFKKHNINFVQQDVSLEIPAGYDLVIIKDVIQHWDDKYILDKFPEILKNNKYVYCINGYKFIRDPSKNNWKNRELDKKYNYHPLSFDKKPFTKFKKYRKEIKTRGAKQYILFEYKI